TFTDKEQLPETTRMYMVENGTIFYCNHANTQSGQTTFRALSVKWLEKELETKIPLINPSHYRMHTNMGSTSIA
ncbi:hypothetical protein PENTCL1PPCAC_8414, partial [Pristionchus entomophagus]